MAELDDILKGDAAPVAAVPEPIAAAPEPTAAFEPVKEPAVAEPTEEPNEPAGGHVPVGVVQAVRKERNDWKEQFARADEERQLLRKQLEQAKSPPPAAHVQEAPRSLPALPNPLEDPQGYANAHQEHLFNMRLDLSEAGLRRALPKEDVDEKIAAFKELVGKNPAIGNALRAQPDPYGWAYEQGKRQLAMREIGDDPASYRTKLEAEFRAKWEAERAATGTPPAAAAAPLNLPTSLANARSAGPRATAAWTGPPSLDDILSKKANA